MFYIFKGFLILTESGKLGKVARKIEQFFQLSLSFKKKLNCLDLCTCFGRCCNISLISTCLIGSALYTPAGMQAIILGPLSPLIMQILKPSWNWAALPTKQLWYCITISLIQIETVIPDVQCCRLVQHDVSLPVRATLPPPCRYKPEFLTPGTQSDSTTLVVVPTVPKCTR